MRLRDDDTLGLPEIARSALLALAGQLDSLAAEVRNIERQLMAWHRQNVASQRLETIPGVGLITATALAVSVPNLARGLAMIDNAADKFCSTQRRQAHILMTVHPVLPGTLKHHNSSFLDQDRVDNLSKAHI